ncbi:hypothetical protein [Rubripirellula lacrimiformis]|uniref:hypothetical protein n=1 Tax=Rubripirellula lacrimiformis TaxID=1930273 RepID=UPI001C54F2AF|nr:hypothetical protein [Rubripirellula lacrimiformis]
MCARRLLAERRGGLCLQDSAGRTDIEFQIETDPVMDVVRIGIQKPKSASFGDGY